MSHDVNKQGNIMNQPGRPAGFRPIWARLALLPLCALAVQAQAQNTGVDTGHADKCMRNTGHPSYRYYQVYPATTIHVGQNAQIGDLIGSWISTTMRPAWKCTRRAAYSGVPVQVSVQSKLVYAHTTYDASVFTSLVAHDGGSYRGSRLGDPSATRTLGYIARWRATIDGVTTDWTPMNLGAGAYQPGPEVIVTKNTGEEYYIQLETQVHFTKHREPPQSGYQQGLVDPTYSWVYQKTGSKYSYGSGQYIIPQMEAGTVTFVKENGTCTTPSASVELPDVGVGEFPNPGTIRGTKNFDLEFQNCPAGLYGIGYYFTPTTTLLDAVQGVIALDGSSTATGVGLKLTEDSGAALKFGQANAYLLAYDPSTVKSYTVPLNVAYYQTDNTVTPGSVKSSVTVTVKYQ